jgi:hypothetical protein
MSAVLNVGAGLSRPALCVFREGRGWTGDFAGEESTVRFPDRFTTLQVRVTRSHKEQGHGIPRSRPEHHDNPEFVPGILPHLVLQIPKARCERSPLRCGRRGAASRSG